MSSLYEKSVVSFSKHIVKEIGLETIDSISIVSRLPVTVQRDVRKVFKSTWLRETSPPESPYNCEFR